MNVVHNSRRRCAGAAILAHYHPGYKSEADNFTTGWVTTMEGFSAGSRGQRISDRGFFSSAPAKLAWHGSLGWIELSAARF